MCVNALPASVCAAHACSAQAGQERAADPLEKVVELCVPHGCSVGA